MECLYCEEELDYHDFYGFAIGRPEFQKSGDIYKCGNEDCEFEGHFHTKNNNDSELYEGYPC